MTLEEAQAKIAALEAENAKLQNQIKNQNSYITKLEAGKSATNPQPGTGTGSGLDPITQRYLEKNMIRDTIQEVKVSIIEQVGQEVFNAIEPDFKAWLDKNLNIKNCTPEYIGDAFNLVYGRCFRDKEHKIHTVLGKDTTPSVTPTPAVQPTVTPSMINTPPVINNRDGNPSPMPTPDVPKSKRDIFKDLGRKLSGQSNPFN